MDTYFQRMSTYSDMTQPRLAKSRSMDQIVTSRSSERIYGMESDRMICIDCLIVLIMLTRRQSRKLAGTQRLGITQIKSSLERKVNIKTTASSSQGTQWSWSGDAIRGLSERRQFCPIRISENSGIGIFAEAEDWCSIWSITVMFGTRVVLPRESKSRGMRLPHQDWRAFQRRTKHQARTSTDPGSGVAHSRQSCEQEAFCTECFWTTLRELSWRSLQRSSKGAKRPETVAECYTRGWSDRCRCANSQECWQ